MKKTKETGHSAFGIYEKYLKRFFDLAISLIAVFFLFPLMAAIGFMVRLKLGKPVLFAQKRPGKDEQIFRLYKFRSMTDEKDENGNLLPDEKRLTDFGKRLRSTSLDELPELFNIIKGEMSLVGPRPLLVEYLPRYSARQKRRHEVRPGLTGLAQVYGRNRLSWPEKLEDDVRYVDHITFLGDVKILLRTVAIVLRREGISSDTSVTMEGFQGNDASSGLKDKPSQ